MPPDRLWHGNASLRRRLVAIGDLHAHPKNARRGVVPEIQESLKRFGQQRAILALPDGTLVAGHHVWMAATEEGWTHVAVDVSDLTEAEVEAYLLADNRLSDLGDYDPAKLAELLEPLRDVDQLIGTGYTPEDVTSLLDELAWASRPRGNVDQDEAPPVPPNPHSNLGDLYELGPHRLLCGDAGSATAYEELLGAEVDADLVWTDPPYGVDVIGGSRAQPKSTRKLAGHKTIQNDKLSPEAMREFLLLTLGCAHERTRRGGSWYVAGPAGDAGDIFTEVLRSLGVRRHTLVWVKDSLILSHMDYHYRHEMIFYGWREGPRRVRPPDRKQDSVFEVPRPRRSELHPTMKPVELVQRCVENSTRAGDVVLDPFAGAGSTLIACEESGRVARLLELDPGYCDVIRQRYADFTGQPHLAP